MPRRIWDAPELADPWEEEDLLDHREQEEETRVARGEARADEGDDGAGVVPSCREQREI